MGMYPAPPSPIDDDRLYRQPARATLSLADAEVSSAVATPGGARRHAAGIRDDRPCPWLSFAEYRAPTEGARAARTRARQAFPRFDERGRRQRVYAGFIAMLKLPFKFDRS